MTIFGESAGLVFGFRADGLADGARACSTRRSAKAAALLGQSLAGVDAGADRKRMASSSESAGSDDAGGDAGKARDDVLAVARKLGPGIRFRANIDGYFIPESPLDIYASGKQAPVPLLAGWNVDEQGPGGLFGKEPQTLENYKAAAFEKRFGDNAAKVLAAYPADSDQTAKRAAATSQAISSLGTRRGNGLSASLRCRTDRQCIDTTSSRHASSRGRCESGWFHSCRYRVRVRDAGGITQVAVAR